MLGKIRIHDTHTSPTLPPQVTRAANVWSFGVLAWEVVCRGQMPYPGLDDDQVIQRVVMDKLCVPDQPTAFHLHQDKL